MQHSSWLWLSLALLGVGTLTGCGTVSREAPSDPGAAAADIVIDRWTQASGGAAVLKRIESIVSRVSLDYGEGLPKIEGHAWVTKSGAYRLEAAMPAGTLVEAYDGQTAWREHEKFGFGLVPSHELAIALRRNDISEPLNVRTHYPVRQRLADAAFGNRLCQVVRVVDRDGAAETWFFDAASGQRVGVQYEGPGHLAGTVYEYSDFRSVDGFTVPWVFRQSRGEAGVKGQLQELRLNERVDQDRFKAPAQSVADARLIQQVLDRQLAAIGGKAAFQRLESRVTRSTLEITTAGVKMAMTVSQKRPDRVLIEQDIPAMGRQWQGYDGKTGWALSDLQGYRTLSGAELLQLLNNVDLRAEAELSERCPFRTLVGARDVLGRTTTAVALGSMLGPAGVYYFDDESGLLVRVESTLVAGPDSTLPVTVDFGDFREVDGITMPFVVTTSNPAMHMVITVQAVANNVPLDEAIFTPRTEAESPAGSGAGG